MIICGYSRPEGAARDSLDYILLDDWPILDHSLELELRQVDGFIFSCNDEFTEAATDSGRLLQAVAAEAVRDEQVAHIWMSSDESVMVEYIYAIRTMKQNKREKYL